VAAGLYGLAAVALWGTDPPPLAESALLQAGTSLVAFGLATWVFGFRVARLSPAQLRWTPGGRRGFFLGLALGMAPAALALAAALPLAGAGWAPDGGAAADWAVTVAATTALLLPAAFVEELIFRGVPQVVLGQAFGRGTAIVILAGVFALAHGLNPGITPLAAGNIALAGVFLGVCFYLPGGLWAATGAHLGWNLTLAALAAPVSGLPFAMPWLDYRAGAPEWLSGGDFGPEGGLLATAALALAAVLALRLIRRSGEK
jgi:membrane protease YdiL (CAAX protease family)